MELNDYGYFEGESYEPTYDPGLLVKCPYCNTALSKPMKTISFSVPGSNRSWFYRMHKHCCEDGGDEFAKIVESFIVDLIEFAPEN